MRLWHKYEEFRDAGVVEQMLDEIYREGRKWGYKPPSEQESGEGGGAGPEAPGAAKGRAGGGAGSSSSRAPSREAPTGLSAPPTPVGKRGIPRESEYFESPLR